MTLALAAGRPRTDRATGSARAALVLVGTAALWAICHPYGGIVGDSTIYLGRALADLDPNGLGRDLAFALDGQSRFSLFPFVAKLAVAALGPARAGLLIALLGSACFVAALGAFARALAPGRLALAIVLASCVLPGAYGQLGIFHFGEASAVPRPFAEAAVMAGMAALIAGRARLATAALGVALALHPIMALAGIASAGIHVVARSDRSRRIVAGWVAAGGLGTALGLGLLGVPLFDRLVTRFDPAWFGFLFRRSPYLFPTCWHADSFGPILAQAATVAIAASFMAGRARAVLLSVLATAFLGLAAAAILGDGVHIVLALQVQFWRATWLLAVVGGAALVLCARFLWSDGPRGRVTLTLLALAWFFEPDLLAQAVFGAAALALRFGTFPFAITTRHAALVAAVAGVLLLLWLAEPLAGYVHYLRHTPRAAPIRLVDLLRNRLQTVPALLVIAGWLLRWWRGPVPFAAVCGGTAVLAVAAVALWDQRTPYQAYVEAGQPPAAFAALAPNRSAEVLWIDGLADGWFLFRRPQWASPEQAAGAVFSRELARAWGRRAQTLVALGLAHRSVFHPWDAIAADDRIRVTPAAVAALCRRPDAPGTVVIPLRDDRPALDLPGSLVWRVPEDWEVENDATPEWHATRALQAVGCSARR